MFFLEGREVKVGDTIYTCVFCAYQKSRPSPSKRTVTKLGRKYITLCDDYGTETKVAAQWNFNGTRFDLAPDRYSWYLDRWSIFQDVVNLRFELMRCIDEFPTVSKTRAQHLQQIQMLNAAINALKEEVK